MIDIELKANNFGIFDILIENGLTQEDTLKTAIIISLFTDARHEGERGSVIDTLDGNSWGSKIWTLRREKLTTLTQEKLEKHARDSLQWLIDDKIAQSIEVSSEIIKPRSIYLTIKIFKPSGSVSGYRFSNIWGE